MRGDAAAGRALALALIALSLWGASALAPSRDRHRLEPAEIDIDRATPGELSLLPRIGPALADRIVADRDAHGPFGSIKSLDRVPGIGPATVSAIEASGCATAGSRHG